MIGASAFLKDAIWLFVTAALIVIPLLLHWRIRNVRVPKLFVFVVSVLFVFQLLVLYRQWCTIRVAQEVSPTQVSSIALNGKVVTPRDLDEIVSVINTVRWYSPRQSDMANERRVTVYLKDGRALNWTAADNRYGAGTIFRLSGPGEFSSGYAYTSRTFSGLQPEVAVGGQNTK